VTVTVDPAARIVFDDAPATLAALPVGVHVVLVGTVSGTTRTVTQVIASDR
jgi:hypothetical protein